MRKPVWRHDWAGYSGGWYPKHDNDWGLTILGIYYYGYFLDVDLPNYYLRVGFFTKEGMENPYHRPRPKRRLVFNLRKIGE